MVMNKSGSALLLQPFNPLPTMVMMAEQIDRMAGLDPKIQEASSLAESCLSDMDEDTLTNHVGPLLWKWAAIVGFPAVWPPPFFPQNWTPWPDWPAHIPLPPWLSDGGQVLLGTEMLLDGYLGPDSIDSLTNELEHWSRTADGNTDQLAEAQDGFRQFLDEYSKLAVERKAPLVAGGVVLAVFVGAAVIGYLAQ